MSDIYDRYLAQRGVRYLTEQEERIRYQSVIERHVVPNEALVFGENPGNGRRVYVMPEDLKTHLHVVGWSQRGKTNFLKGLVKSLLDRQERCGEGLAIVDPHGPLAQYVLDLCVQRGPEFAEQVFYFDLKSEGSVPIFNPLKPGQGLELVAGGFTEAVVKAWGVQYTMQNPLIAEVLRNTALVLLHNGLSLAEASFLTNNTKENLVVREKLLEAVPTPELRDYWRELGGVSARERRIETALARRRFDSLLNVPTIRRILGQNTPGIDLAEIVEAGGIAIFDLSTGGTEVPLDMQHLLGALVVQEFRTLTLRREVGARPFHLLIDEFGEFVSHDVMRVFTEAAKFGLRCVLAHQGMYQLMLGERDTQLLESVLAIDRKVIFGGGLVEEKERLARQAYASWVDADKRKVEIYTKAFRPVLRREWLESYGGSRGSAYGSQSSSSEGTSRQRLPLGEEDEPPWESEGSSEGSSWSGHENEVWGSHETFVTDHEEFEQLTSVQFEHVEEQIFRHMQELQNQPVGRCTFVDGKEAPQPCQVPLVEETGVSAEEREAFLERVYEKPAYVSPEQADRLIAERRMKLLGSGEDRERMPTLESDGFWEKE